MVKGVKGKSTSSRKSPRKNSIVRVNKIDKNMEKVLVENFISLQKIMTSFVSKFDKLEKQMSSLLDLFEESAKTIAEKEINLELKGNEEKQQEILNKLREVLDQNKLIAKGITLMHESSVANIKESVSNLNENNNFSPKLMPSRPMNKPSENFSTPETMPSFTPSFKKPIVKEEVRDSFSNSSVDFSI